MRHRFTLPRILAILLSGVAFSLVSGGVLPAAAAPHGGSGGNPFTLQCGSNEVLSALDLQTGTLVDRIVAHCQKIDSEKKWTGGSRLVGSTAGTGGSANNIHCESHGAIVGIHGRSGALVDALGAMCRRVDGSGSAVSRGPYGGGGGNAFNDPCPSGQVAIGIRGRAGTLIDQVELICGAVPAGEAAARMIISGAPGQPRASTSVGGPKVVAG